jgi:hypothetical protein
MLKQSAHSQLNCIFRNHIRRFILISVLLAVPLLSAQGQIYLGGRSCIDAGPNRLAICGGYVKCNTGLFNVTILGQTISKKFCNGWIVWNHSNVIPIASPPALKLQGYSTLQVSQGQLLEYRFTTHPCIGAKSTEGGVVMSCPTSPIGSGDDELVASLLWPSPNSSSECAAQGMFWSFTEQTCFPQTTDPTDCTTYGGYWNFSSGDCSETEVPIPCETCLGNDDCCYGDVCHNGQCGPPELYCPPCPPDTVCVEGLCSYCTPILIDVDGDGFDLTNAAGGVNFDFDGDGVAQRISWPAVGSDDSWLVLDRNGNGKIDSARELFGNVTPQPAAPTGQERNGFLALAEFDTTQKGGNGDGRIDSKDVIFRSLQLWRDVNHNGYCEPDELNYLSQLGLMNIELNYKQSKKTDKYGNRFGYRAKVTDSRDLNNVNRWAWDVILVQSK